MRPRTSRAVLGALLAGATLFAASACANPPGTDGNLTNQWPGMTAVVGWEPKAGTCHDAYSTTSYRAAYAPIDCNSTHHYETVHVGTFTGDAAKLTTVPLLRGAEVQAAWAECDAKTTEFLGGQWRNGRIGLGVSLPSTGAWEGGARWFRCEIYTEQADQGAQGVWNKSLKGEFAAASELKYGCFQIPEDFKDLEPVDCGTAHNGEFAGVFMLTESYDGLAAAEDSIHQKCRSTIANYVGVPDNGDMRYRTGTSYSYASKADWEAGDHSIRCRLYLGAKKVSKSLKGTGNSGLPINYK